MGHLPDADTEAGGHQLPRQLLDHVAQDPLPRASWEFLKWLGSPEGNRNEVERSFAQPHIRGLEPFYMQRVPIANKKTASEGLQYAKTWIMGVKHVELERALGEGLGPLWRGEASAREVVSALKPRLDQILRS